MKSIGLAVLFTVLMSCGGAHEGTPCQDGTPQCQDNATALFCDNGFYRAIPCNGAGGCTATTVGNEPVIRCALGQIHSGEECDENYAGLVGECDRAPDGGAVAEICGGDIWRATACPTSCELGQPGVGTVADPGTCD